MFRFSSVPKKALLEKNGVAFIYRYVENIMFFKRWFYPQGSEHEF